MDPIKIPQDSNVLPEELSFSQNDSSTTAASYQSFFSSKWKLWTLQGRGSLQNASLLDARCSPGFPRHCCICSSRLLPRNLNAKHSFWAPSLLQTIKPHFPWHKPNTLNWLRCAPSHSDLEKQSFPKMLVYLLAVAWQQCSPNYPLWVALEKFVEV